MADPEPDGLYSSRTEREPKSPTRCGPRPEPDPRTVADPEPDGPSPRRMEREPYTLRTWSGAEPNAGPEPNDPLARYSSVTRARDAKARTALRRQEATSKDLGLRLCLA